MYPVILSWITLRHAPGTIKADFLLKISKNVTHVQNEISSRTWGKNIITQHHIIWSTCFIKWNEIHAWIHVSRTKNIIMEAHKYPQGTIKADFPQPISRISRKFPEWNFVFCSLFLALGPTLLVWTDTLTIVTWLPSEKSPTKFSPIFSFKHSWKSNKLEIHILLKATWNPFKLLWRKYAEDKIIVLTDLERKIDDMNPHACGVRYWVRCRLEAKKANSFNLPYFDIFLNIWPGITLNKRDFFR